MSLDALAELSPGALRARLAALTPGARREAEGLIEALHADRRAHPLAYARLWHRDAPRTSQRTAARAVLAHGVRRGYVLGGNRCLGAEVEVEDPYRGPVPIGSFGSGHVWAWDGAGYVVAPAVSWERKGPDSLLRVGLVDGRSFTATAGHRVLTARGWLPVGDVRAGDWLHGCAPSPRRTTADTAVASVKPARTDYHYDLFVPGYHNYMAAGVVHHNSGKSELGAQLDVAWALGRDHPDVVRWAARNRLDVLAIPTGPGRVCSSALTNGDSRRYLRPKVARYLPDGSTWRNRDGQGESEVVLPNGGMVVFKSVDQGREGYQGDAFRWMRFDEEPSLPVIEESEMRVADQRGRIVCTMTPLQGWTSLLERDLRLPSADVVTTWVHGTDNPHVPADELLAILARYGPHMQAARGRGEITALEGRVWDGWRRDLHVRDDVVVDDSWTHYLAIDWGTSVPTHMVHASYQPSLDLLYVRAEWERTQTTIGTRVDAIRALEAEYGACALRWADPEDASTSRTVVVEHGIALTSARKDVLAGINAVAARLAPDATGRPHLIVHPRCRVLVRQLEGYVWSSTKRDAPSKVDDHGCDALRYLTMGVGRAYKLATAEV